MKPSDFILNSDYLSIAQVSSNTYTLTIGGGTLVVGGYSERNLDFTSNTLPGTIDRIIISKDGGSYRIGSSMEFDPNNEIRGTLHVYRPSQTILRAQVILQNYSAGSASYPSMSFSIKVSSFRPPNIV